MLFVFTMQLKFHSRSHFRLNLCFLTSSSSSGPSTLQTSFVFRRLVLPFPSLLLQLSSSSPNLERVRFSQSYSSFILFRPSSSLLLQLSSSSPNLECVATTHCLQTQIQEISVELLHVPCRDPDSHNPQTFISRGRSFFLVVESMRPIRRPESPINSTTNRLVLIKSKATLIY